MSFLSRILMGRPSRKQDALDRSGRVGRPAHAIGPGVAQARSNDLFSHRAARDNRVGATAIFVAVQRPRTSPATTMQAGEVQAGRARMRLPAAVWPCDVNSNERTSGRLKWRMRPKR